MSYERYKLTHEEGVNFLVAFINLIYNFIRSFRKKNDNE